MSRLHSVAILISVLLVMSLLTSTHCIIILSNNSSSNAFSWCQGGTHDDPSCLIGQTDSDSEFALDSESSRRILKTINPFTPKTRTPGDPLSCDRFKKPGCHPGQKNPKHITDCRGAFGRTCWKHT
ncbi:hypothetical protein M0R45_025023 [Rubus argutus]|uniref:Uncharacterized protein n=1 Tax=Rubus argutus TaxID=59490 RepID=A0AAW1WWS5_RUBAR